MRGSRRGCVRLRVRIGVFFNKGYLKYPTFALLHTRTRTQPTLLFLSLECIMVLQNALIAVD